MRRFSFITIIFCMIAPPVCYIFTLNYLESYLQDRFKNEVEEIYIGDSGVLLKGQLSLKTAIADNIRKYIDEKNFETWGITVEISVITKRGLLLYPVLYDVNEEDDYSKNPLQIASNNYRLLSEGLSVRLELKIERYAVLSVCVILFFIGVSLLLLYYYYRLGIRQARLADYEKDLKIERLQEVEQLYTDSLKELEKKREQLSAELSLIQQELEKEKDRASKNEEDLIDEIVTLEDKIKDKQTQLSQQEEDVTNLEEKIALLEKGKEKELKHKLKAVDSILRRFNALYKNLVIHKRAVNGFADIPEELKIKAEEVIHQLNDERNKVPIKRKVFGKKERETVFEIVFAYKGRLYYRVLKDNRVEIVSIGTKNTQAKDLFFLDNL